jgi:hypothetical protein
VGVVIGDVSEFKDITFTMWEAMGGVFCIEVGDNARVGMIRCKGLIGSAENELNVQREVMCYTRSHCS